MIRIFEKQLARILLVAFSIGTAVMVIYSVAAQTPDCSRTAGDLPNANVEPGTANESIPIDHVIVIMQENHSFDVYFGRLNESGYSGEVDGLTDEMFNPDQQGNPVHQYPEWRYCVRGHDHSWNGSHIQYNNGQMDLFVVRSGESAMGNYGPEDLPYYYALANNFAIGDRYFSSVMAPTGPNRFYLLSATSFGTIRNVGPGDYGPTIFHLLSNYKINAEYYMIGEAAGALRNDQLSQNGNTNGVGDFFVHVTNGSLPPVAFVYLANDEHPPENIQFGQAAVAQVINAVMASPLWERSAIFFTYDESDGYFDHVPPPQACIPDDYPPQLEPGDFEADFDQYGFRVPIVVVSPYAKRHYVSHEIYDHTSILRFIETKFNLPALTARDANANPMLDFFDFTAPDFNVPQMPEALIDPFGVQDCLDRGFMR